MNLWKILNTPLFGTVPQFRWREPYFMPMRLHRNFLTRLLLSEACGLAVANCATALAIAEGRELGEALVMGTFASLFMGAIFAVGIFLYPEAPFGSSVQVSDRWIRRRFSTMGVMEAVYVQEEWHYEGLTSILVPGKALGLGFDVLALPSCEGAGLSFIGIPPHVKLEELIGYLELCGATVEIEPEFASNVRSRPPYSRLWVTVVVCGCAIVAVGAWVCALVL